MSSQLECEALPMVGMHLGVFENWAFVTDGPGATVHSCTGFEAWMAVL